MALDKNDIMALIAILQKGLSEDEPKTETTKPKNKKATNIKKKRGKVVADDSGNKFLTMGYSNLHKEDTAIDKILAKSPRTPRRKKVEYVKVTCRSCGKTEQISPALLHESSERYKCNTCSTSPG